MVGWPTFDNEREFVVLVAVADDVVVAVVSTNAAKKIFTVHSNRLKKLFLTVNSLLVTPKKL